MINKTMKKTLCLVCAMTLAAGLTACSGETPDDTISAAQSAASTAAVREESAASDASDLPVNVAPASFAQLSSKKHGWGQGTQTDAQNRPISGDDFNEKYGKYDAIFIGGAREKKLYLTFDEGYENGYTAAILDVLKQKQTPAVFFVTRDYVQSNPALVRRMLDEGHIVGNHSWSHPSMPTLSVEKAKAEIQKLDAYMQQEFGYRMTLFRPPMGEFSERSLAVTQSLGYKSVFWSFAHRDWDPKDQPDTAAALKKTVACLHSGAIYLLHAVSKTNAAILGDFIDRARAQGYAFCAFDL